MKQGKTMRHSEEERNRDGERDQNREVDRGEKRERERGRAGGKRGELRYRKGGVVGVVGF